jgi:hypothetical protein
MVLTLIVRPEQDGGGEGLDVLAAISTTDHQEDLEETRLRSQNILAGIHLQVAGVVRNLWTTININARGSHARVTTREDAQIH